MRGILFAITAAAAIVAANSAHAGLNFDFSFTNINGSVSGTVTGEIFGLADNTSNEAATDVVIDGYPAGLSLPPTPWDIFNAAGFSITSNSFSVASGVITDLDFEETDNPIVFALNGAAVESALQDVNHKNIANNTGFAGITFSAVPAPEPASMALLLSGLFGLRLIRRRG